jgi:hypothetical protein
MPHTDEEIQIAADRLERRLDELEPDTIDVDDTSDLRAIAEAVDALRAAEAQVRERVEIARARGRSWNLIALPLGVSRQAARERFAQKIAGGRR